MLPPGVESEIKSLWNRFWSGGIANPLTAIEQITYLIFLKRIEDEDNRRAEENSAYRSYFDGRDDPHRWSVLKNWDSRSRLELLRGDIFDWLKTLNGGNADRMRDAICLIPSDNLLQAAMESIDRLFDTNRYEREDILGDIYEELLSEVSSAGKNGQFRTPRHIIRAICELVDVRPGDRVIDPACGTGGFLFNAYHYILASHTNRDSLQFTPDGTPFNTFGDLLTPEQEAALHSKEHFNGYDFDRTMSRLGWMNMLLHHLDNSEINYADTLGNRFNEEMVKPLRNGQKAGFDVALANPPFTGNIDKSDIGQTLNHLGTTKTELLFVELILQLLKTGGRAGVIVPEGLLFGSTRAHLALRKQLVTENQLEAVISLPGGVFQPYTGVKTSILLFTKGGSTREVWFYEVQEDGQALNAKRTERPEKNDLWDLILKYRLRQAANYREIQPPAFVDEATWQEWRRFTPAERSLRYAQPKEFGELQQEEGAIKVFQGLKTEEIKTAKDWTATLEELAANDYNLSAGRYKPEALAAVHHDPPAVLIQSLLKDEAKITEGLRELLDMVEGKR
ncbi:MAG TPA: class I SAM-dependent DNA methyltransferase [Chloroflexia bacterium]|nr:class I SAM-dependent DNA methyltransferase [Chloroflexia bacterium]